MSSYCSPMWPWYCSVSVHDWVLISTSLPWKSRLEGYSSILPKILWYFTSILFLPFFPFHTFVLAIIIAERMEIMEPRTPNNISITVAKQACMILDSRILCYVSPFKAWLYISSLQSSYQVLRTESHLLVLELEAPNHRYLHTLCLPPPLLSNTWSWISVTHILRVLLS